VKAARVIVWGAVAATAVCAPGCGEDAAPRRPLGGAGLRIVFGAGPLPDSVRVELWQENAVLPPTCVRPGAARGMAGSSILLLDAAPAPGSPRGAGPRPGQPLCTRGRLEIRDWRGELVRVEPDLPWRERIPAWDQRDQAGRWVSEGIYPVFWRCLDSAGNFTFEGHYFVTGEATDGACRWLLWSAVLRPVEEGRRVEIAPFPASRDVLTFDPESGSVQEVSFSSPFAVRIALPGGETLERTVQLREESYTEIDVARETGRLGGV
jgi:hypothetical protein